MRRGVNPPWEAGRCLCRGILHHGRQGGVCAEVSLLKERINPGI